MINNQASVIRATFISYSISCGGTVEEDKALINPKKDRMRER